jgi:hypothetical protein
MVFTRTGTLNKPPELVLSAIAKLRSQHIDKGHKLVYYISDMAQKYPNPASTYEYQGPSNDYIFKADYPHKIDNVAFGECCDIHSSDLVLQKHRTNTSPRIYSRTIGSANNVMKDSIIASCGIKGQRRNILSVLRWRPEVIAQISSNLIISNLLSKGIMDSSQCLAIRGISDYADSHKNQRWQPYAAATASVRKDYSN